MWLSLTSVYQKLHVQQIKLPLHSVLCIQHKHISTATEQVTFGTASDTTCSTATSVLVGLRPTISAVKTWESECRISQGFLAVFPLPDVISLLLDSLNPKPLEPQTPPVHCSLLGSLRHELHQPHLKTASNLAYILLTHTRMEHGGSNLLEETFNENWMVERSQKPGTSGTLAKQNIIWLHYFNLFTVATNQISNFARFALFDLYY